MKNAMKAGTVLGSALMFALPMAAQAKPAATGPASTTSPAAKTWWCITHPSKCAAAGNGGGGSPPPRRGPQALPPPPPPPPAMCAASQFIIFFAWNRSDITLEAATVLDAAIGAYGSCGNIPIALAGHSDTSGTQAYNLGLSERRDNSVRAYLTARGIPDATITAQAFGETRPLVPTPDGVREAQNRRVEITYGGGM